ncbi:uncharacterized protein LOC129968700 [Argiope bruennichi]|uniref:uncharacterized protein LOC129968700 n=1 Tax=Argiope bruennichi TaxID=94029 RepID=UPI0024952038|nr:uncharacterized protein LOC129968700 [Argiope bruennichi]
MNLKFAYDSCKSTPFSIPALTFAVIGCISLIVALSSPRWLESEPESKSNFVRLGLWSVCFRDYQHPSLKFDGVFNGCYSLHGQKSKSIRNWLHPGWFVFVQCLTTSSTLLCTLCVGILVFMHFQTEIEIKIFISTFVFVFEALSALSAFLAVSVFGAMCFERSWIQYPKYNSLSLGYVFAVIGALSLGVGACLLLAQTFRMRRFLYRNSTVMYHIPVPNP